MTVDELWEAVGGFLGWAFYTVMVVIVGYTWGWWDNPGRKEKENARRKC